MNAAAVQDKYFWNRWLLFFALIGWLLSAALLAFIIFGGAAQTGFRVNSAGGLQEMDPVTARTFKRVLRQKGIAPANITVHSTKDDSSALQGSGRLASFSAGHPIY
jgi:hypothetical protein